MSMRACVWLIVLTCAAATLAAQAPAGLPLWAYGYIAYPAMPGDYTNRCQGERADPCDRPGGLPTDPNNTARTLQGSDRTYTVAQINARYNPADWFPGDHPPMPDVVAHGKEANGVRACGICHLPNGKGLMQNGSVSGLPREYILQQLGDFKAGKRHTADPNKANGYEMQAIARNLTGEEAQAAADYFSSVKYTKWVRVVESETAPAFTASVNGLFLKAEGNETIPLGNRVVEMPEDTYQTNILRNPRSGFVAYAPVGSITKGEALADAGKCGTCHGADLRGMMMQKVVVPPIAGRSPSYIGRALYDFQQGARGGANAVFMKAAVQKLSEDDVIALAAYVASLEP
ncbi:MAG TPA: c-type cytochrome [Vicinamibacterales bacterium]|nr:c-type cytochrome [Vicinamibacterales bacterium]